MHTITYIRDYFFKATKVGDYPGRRRLWPLRYSPEKHSDYYDVSIIYPKNVRLLHTLFAYFGVSLTRLAIAIRVRLLANSRDLGGTNRILSQGQFSLEKVGDYPGSRRLLKVQINNH